MKILSDILVKAGVTVEGTITGNAIVKAGGTSSQFLKADGSVDSTTYAAASSLSNYLPLSGGTLTGTLYGTIGNFSGALQGASFTDGYINIGSGQINYNSNILNIQYPGTGSVKFFGGGSTPIVFGINGSVTAYSFVKSGGTSSQFLKADGSVDSTSYQSSITPGSITSSTVGIGITNGPNSTIGPNVAINISYASASSPGLLASADWNIFNNKQNALSGTGFVKISGTTISYDNSTYLTSYTETSTLANVTARGASSSTQITLSGAGDNSTTYSSLRFAGYNQGGGVGYHGFFEVQNTYGSVTNGKKFFRMDGSGAIQIINSAYTSNIFNLTDAGALTVNSIIKSGGTSAQILMADGSVVTAGTGITISGGTISSSGGGGGVTSFNTRTGAVTLSSSDVTTALGYTPYNSTNPNGYITAGGTLTGYVSTANGDFAIVNTSSGTGASWIGRTGVKNSGSDRAVFLGTYNGNAIVGAHNNALTAWANLYINNVDGSNGANVYLPTNSYVATNVILHAGNYTSYSPSLTGSGASGTWGINITGFSSSVYLGGSSSTAILSSAWAGAGGYPGYQYTGGNSRFGFSSTSGYIDVYTDGNFYAGIDINGSNNLVLHAGNYNSYAPTLTGGNASGTWGINITGASSNATYLNSGNYIQRTGTSGNYNTDFQNTPAGTVRHHGDDPNATNNPGGTWWFIDNYRHSNASNYWGIQVAWGWEDNANRLATRNISGGSFGGWVYYIHSGNIGSQSVSYASSAGTSSSCSGNAATSTNVYNLNYAVGNSYTWTGIQYFLTNNGTSAVNNSNSAMLEAYSTGGNSAFMSFHRSGYYAINMGLDGDNVFRIGGWSASGNRLQMDMSGNLTMAGDVTAYSDARVKENVVTVDNALKKVLGLRGVYYNRIDSDDKKRKLGVIAQETLAVVPEVVNQDNDGMYNVSYGNLGGLFIEAIKEQQLKIEAQDKIIDELKSIINGLTK